MVRIGDIVAYDRLASKEASIDDEYTNTVASMARNLFQFSETLKHLDSLLPDDRGRCYRKGILIRFQNSNVIVLDSGGNYYATPSCTLLRRLPLSSPLVLEPTVSIHHGDFCDVLEKIDVASHDLAIVDVFYNLGQSHYGSYADNLPEDQYIDKITTMASRLGPVRGVFIMKIGASHKSPSLPLRTANAILDRTEWKALDTFFWQKKVANPGSDGFRRINEFVFVFEKTEERLKDARLRHQQTSIHNPWYIALGWQPMTSDAIIQESTHRRDHKRFYQNDATCASELVQRLLATFAEPGQRVIDCCAGSGTTGVCSLQAGISATLIDIDKDACDYMRDIRFPSRAPLYEEPLLGPLGRFILTEMDRTADDDDMHVEDVHAVPSLVKGDVVFDPVENWWVDGVLPDEALKGGYVKGVVRSFGKGDGVTIHYNTGKRRGEIIRYGKTSDLFNVKRPCIVHALPHGAHVVQNI